MIKFFICLLYLLMSAAAASACDLYLPCESVEAIYVSKGTEHLGGGKEKLVYVACVDVDAAKLNLEEAVAGCDHESVVVINGKTSISVPKENGFGGANSFCIIRLKPQEALDAAMSLCPGKVKSCLPQ